MPTCRPIYIPRILSTLWQAVSVGNIAGGQPIAVKALSLRGQGFDWKQLQLLEREAKAVESLSHQGIPRYIDYFEVDAEQDRGFFPVPVRTPSPRKLSTFLSLAITETTPMHLTQHACVWDKIKSSVARRETSRGVQELAEGRSVAEMVDGGATRMRSRRAHCSCWTSWRTSPPGDLPTPIGRSKSTIELSPFSLRQTWRSNTCAAHVSSMSKGVLVIQVIFGS